MMQATPLDLALTSAAVLGLRHGFDYDHIAAISDITSVESSRRQAMRMGLLYVLGHAAMVAVLGSAVVTLQRSLPRSLDNWAERAVGFTLLALGVYVLATLLRDQTNLPRSRASILIGWFTWLGWKFQQIWGARSAAPPAPRSGSYSPQSVFLIGIIHGLGAETPSQLLVFLLAANLGGLARGFLGLCIFLTGLLAMNTLMTASAIGLFGLSAAKPAVLRFVIGAAAAYSVVVGSIFLFGAASLLPPLGGYERPQAATAFARTHIQVENPWRCSRRQME